MDSEYDEKIKELQAFLPALDRKINDARNKKNNSVVIPLEKVRNIVIKKIKVPMTILLRTEEAIKKFTKDTFASSKSEKSAQNSCPATSSNSVSEKREYKVEIKQELGLESTKNDDDDDVQIIQPKSSEVIVLDDSDEEETTNTSHKEPDSSEKQVSSNQNHMDSTRNNEIPDPNSKEIMRIKEEQPDSQDQCPTERANFLQSVPEPHVQEESENRETSAIGREINKTNDDLVFSKQISEKQDSYQDDVACRNINFPPLSTSAEPIPHCSKDQVIPQVKFDPNKVAESRDILLQIESQLKELSSAKKLSLSIDDEGSQKEDAVKEFLSRSTGSPTSEKLNFELQPYSEKVIRQSTTLPETLSKRVDENYGSSSSQVRSSLLPFPFPNFNQGPNPLLEIQTVTNTESNSSQESNTTKSTDQNSNTETTTQDQDKLENSISIKNCDDQINSDSVATLNNETNADNSSKACTSDSTANNRLSEIIANLTKNLSPSIEKIDPVTTNNAGSQIATAVAAPAQPLPELFVNKITLTDIPAVVQDMLNHSIETDEENRSGLVIDEPGNLSAQLLDDLDDFTINSIGNVSDLPEKILNAEDDDSLDLEISQAIAENGGLNVDSSELPDVLELSDEILGESEKLQLDISEVDTKLDEKTTEENNSTESITNGTKLSEKDEHEINAPKTDEVMSSSVAISTESNEKSAVTESSIENAVTIQSEPCFTTEKPMEDCVSDSTGNGIVSLADAVAEIGEKSERLGPVSSPAEGAGKEFTSSSNEITANPSCQIQQPDESKDQTEEKKASDSHVSTEIMVPKVPNSTILNEDRVQVLPYVLSSPHNNENNDISVAKECIIIDQCEGESNVNVKSHEADVCTKAEPDTSSATESLTKVASEMNSTESKTSECVTIERKECDSTDQPKVSTNLPSALQRNLDDGPSGDESSETRSKTLQQLPITAIETISDDSKDTTIDEAAIWDDLSEAGITSSNHTKECEENVSNVAIELASSKAHFHFAIDTEATMLPDMVTSSEEAIEKHCGPVKELPENIFDTVDDFSAPLNENTTLLGKQCDAKVENTKISAADSSLNENNVSFEPKPIEILDHSTNQQESNSQISLNVEHVLNLPSASEGKTGIEITATDSCQDAKQIEILDCPKNKVVVEVNTQESLKSDQCKVLDSSAIENTLKETDDNLNSSANFDHNELTSTAKHPVVTDEIAAASCEGALNPHKDITVPKIPSQKDKTMSSILTSTVQSVAAETLLTSEAKSKTQDLSNSGSRDRNDSNDLKHISTKTSPESSEFAAEPKTAKKIDTNPKSQDVLAVLEQQKASTVQSVATETLLTSKVKSKPQTLSKSGSRDRNDSNDLKHIAKKTLPESSEFTAEPKAAKNIDTNPQSQDDLALLEQQKAEIERKIYELKKEPQSDLQSPPPQDPKTSNLSEISESDADYVSLSLSDISDPESGEIRDKTPTPLRKVTDIKDEPSEIAVSNRIKFATDTTSAGTAPLRVTIPNDDLRVKLTNKRKKRKHRKRNKRSRKENENENLADEIEPPVSPIRYVDFQGNVRIIRGVSTSDSDEEQLNISPRKPKRRSLKSKQKASELLGNPLYSQLDFMKADDDESLMSYEENLEINNMQKYPGDDKCRIQNKLRYRSPNFDENTRFSLQDDVECKNTSRLSPLRREISRKSPSPRIKLERKRSKSPKRFANPFMRSVSPKVKAELRYSRSPGRCSKSPVKLNKSPNKFTSRRSPSPRVKIERRLSRSPRRVSPRRANRPTRSPNGRMPSPRRRSRSPRRFPRSPRRRSMSPRRLSRSPRRRSPIRRARSPRRNSKSPRRLARSPRRKSRSPRKLPISPRRLSRSPRRRSRSPRRRSRSPRRLSRSPRRLSRSPRRLSRSPRRSLRSPRRLSRSPRRLSRSPRRLSRSPRRSLRSPRRLSRSPRRLSRSPRRRSRSPQRLSRSPRRLSRSPRRISKSPQRRSRSPRRLSKSPRRRSRSPRRLSKSPQRLSRSPRKLSRSPRRLSRSPRGRSPRTVSESRKSSFNSPARRSKSPRRLKRSSVSPTEKVSKQTDSPQRIPDDAKEVTSAKCQPDDAKEVTSAKCQPDDAKEVTSTQCQPEATAVANNEVTSSVPSPKAVVYIDLSDTDDEEDKAKAQLEKSAEDEEAVEFTIEVSDDEDFVQAPPPPKISAAELKQSPEPEIEESSNSQNKIDRKLSTEDDQNDVIFIDDDAEAVKSAHVDRKCTVNSKYEALSAETTTPITKLANEDQEAMQEPAAQIVKTEQTPESEQSQPAFSDTSDVENSSAQETEETLKEKNLNELHEMKIKLEREIGIDPNLLDQLIGNAMDKINDPASINTTEDSVHASLQHSTLPTMVSVSPYFYQSRVQSAMAHVSSKDPRLNRVRPPLPPPAPVSLATTELIEAPPPPLIPRLTPAVALPQSSQPSKSRARTDSFSDEDYLSSGTISDENSNSGSEKRKEFITIEVSKLEEIISQQIQKVLAKNKSLLAPQVDDTLPTKKGRQRKEATVVKEATKSTDKVKPMKNACSKDGSGPRHMNADKILSEILKGSTPINDSNDNATPEKSKTAKPRRILNRIESSPEPDTENIRERDVGKTRKSPIPSSDTLRSRITHDTAGIIKLGKASSTAKIKPKPALKQAERTTDANLLTPLREMPYEESRRKKQDSHKRAPKNTDQSMHCNLKDTSCLLCKDKGIDELISHYVNIHREHEVYTARLTAEQAETLKDTPNSVRPTRSSNIEKFFGKCPFCTEEMTCPIGRFMEHFASHTGEYAYECDHCGWRYSRKRDILNHCNTECPKGAKFIYVYRYDLSDKLIEGYVCRHCNYTQLNKANVVKHIRSEHDQQQIRSDDYFDVILLKVRERQPGDEDETLDNIEVGNEAIADEDDDYDNYEDAPESPASDTAKRGTNPSEAIEYVKNELLIDAIDDIDWKSLEDTLVTDSVEVTTKPPVSTDQEISKQIFTEIHANLQENIEDVAPDTVLNLKPMTIVNTSDSNGPSVEANLTVEVKPALDVSTNDSSVGSPKTPAPKSNSAKKSKTSKRIEFKDVASLGPNVFRVYSVGFERLSSNVLRYHCLFKDCTLVPSSSLEDLRRHMKSHDHKWTGECSACKRDKSKISNKLFPVSREILHLVNEHLPNKSCAGKMMRPWLTNDPSNCQKSKEICEMLKKEFHLENLYKCMGSNCLFTTNSSQDMQFHVTLNHSEDMGALYCCYCEEDFIHCNGLVDHIAKVHGASKYQCSQCFYRSCAAYNVQMHQRTFHTDQKDLKIIICSDQAHTFSTEMLELLDNRQKNVKPLKCPMFSACRKWIYVKHLLMDHIVKDHSHKEPIDVYSHLYHCIHCMYGSDDLLSIRQHMANEHPNRLLYVCGLVFIKALHPLATQGNQIDITSIKTTSLVYIGGKVNESRFVMKNPADHVFDMNSIEAVNSGKDATALNDRIRQTFGEAAVNFSDVETYMRKIAEGMAPDTIQEDEGEELNQLINTAVKNTGLIGKELYKCGFPKCGDAFDTFEQFDRHINGHQGNKKEPIYRCPHCNNIVATNQIRMHTIQHRRHRHICFFCGKSTASQNLAIEHLRKEHQSQSNHFVYLTKDTDWTSVLGENECRIFVAMPRKCNDDVKEKLLSIFRKRPGLEAVEEKPTIERPASPIERKEETPVPVFVALDSRLRCNMDSCPFVAKTEDELMQHFGDRHRILFSGMYSCPHCPYNMGTAQLNPNRIKNHLLYHGPTIVVCNVCNYYHYNRSRVLNHISSCHPYNFVTLTLNARSSNGTKSKIEILYNKSVRSPEDSYKCTICDATLTECDELFLHMKESHQLNVRFKCDACPFFDNSQAEVDIHAKKTHTGEGVIRIRSVFLPSGGKWVQNLSPFELLIECNEDSNEIHVKAEDSYRGDRTNFEHGAVPCTTSGSELAKLLEAPNSPAELSESKAETRKSPPKSPSQTPSNSSKKRKSDDTESSTSSKKSRRSGVKRPGDDTSDENSKRARVASPSERVETPTNPNAILLSILSDTPSKVPKEVAVDPPIPKLKLVPVEKLLRPGVSSFEGPTSADRYPSLEELLRQENPPVDSLVTPTSQPAQAQMPPNIAPAQADVQTALISAPVSVAPDSLRPANIAPGSVVSANVAPGSVVPVDVTPRSVVPVNEARGSVVPVNVTSGSVAPVNVTSGSVVPGNVAPGSVVPVNATPGSIVPVSVAPGTVALKTPQIRRPAQDDVFLNCVYCGTKSECFTKLRSHFRQMHSGDPVHFRVSKKLLCAYCNTNCTFAELKVHHFQAHENDLFITREANYHKKCAECSFVYSQIFELKQHSEMMHKTLYLQMHSSFAYLNQDFLAELLKIGIGQLADVFKCTSCDHKYLQEAVYMNHVLHNHPQTPHLPAERGPSNRILFGCGQCKVFFDTELRVIQHIRKHIDPYGCNHCELSFATHNSLINHYLLFHKTNDQTYQLRNNSADMQKFLEMLLRFPNGLILSKLECEYTDYGQHDQFIQRIESMEKAELRARINQQQRTEQIESITRIKIEIEKEADMFCQAGNALANTTSGQ